MKKKKGSYFVWCKDSQNTNANKKKGSRPPPAARGWSLTSYCCDVVWGRFMNLCQRVEDLFVFLTFFFFNYSTDIVVFYKHSTDAMETVLFSYNTQTKIHLLTERRFNPLFFYFIFLFLWVEDVVQFRLCLWWKVPKISRGILSWFQLQDRYENLWKKKIHFLHL